MALMDYFERFCNRRDNPTMNVIEVEVRRVQAHNMDNLYSFNNQSHLNVHAIVFSCKSQ